jgi:hypothetical protein
MSFKPKVISDAKDELDIALENFHGDHEIEILAGACEEAARSLMEYDECDGIVNELNDAANNIRHNSTGIVSDNVDEIANFVYQINWSFI